MKQPAPPIDLRYRAAEAAYVLHDHALPPADRAHVCLVRGMHPEDLGWLSVVRMFVLYRDVLGDRV